MQLTKALSAFMLRRASLGRRRLEPLELGTLGLDEPVAETWTRKETEYEADNQPYDGHALEEEDASTPSEWLMPQVGKN